jgi:ribosome-associated toxin RatA of RatAB toxin-antitoxin module
MRTIDRTTVRASLDRVYALAADVERWPEILSHYRWVRTRERHAEHAVVEMAAWRPFGPVGWPTWWVSEMEPDARARRIRYRHVAGITRGMDVEWRIEGEDGEVQVEIVHEWAGPRWPLVGRLAAAWVIGPVFVHGIAVRTLAGVKREAER